MKLENKVAVITGSTSGMGIVEAQLFARAGAKVVVVGRNAEAGNRVVSGIKEDGGDALFVQTDITKSESLDRLYREAVNAYGQIDILVNNAGVFDKYCKLLDTSEELWDMIFNSDIKSMFLLTKLVLPQMLERGEGKIINIGSIAGLVANKGGAAYTASKHAVIGLTKHIASEYARFGIKVNCICPGTIITPLIADVAATIPKDNVPMRRFGTPQEVAELCLFLASDEAGFMNGAIIPIDGGYTIL